MAQHNSGSCAPQYDFGKLELPVEIAPVGSRFVRIHHGNYGPIQFGSTLRNRFDDHRKIFGVCYFAKTLEGAFAETFLREAGARIVFQSIVKSRSFSVIEVVEPLRLVTLYGPGLARVGATSAVASGSHADAQLWSIAIHDHHANVDGIVYRSKHDDNELCIALFDRARASIALAGEPRQMQAELQILLNLCERYGLGLE